MTGSMNTTFQVMRSVKSADLRLSFPYLARFSGQQALSSDAPGLPQKVKFTFSRRTRSLSSLGGSRVNTSSLQRRLI